MKLWDKNKKEFVEINEKIKNFIFDFENICLKYNISISHEDGHGSFIFEKYKKENMDSFKNSILNIKDET